MHRNFLFVCLAVFALAFQATAATEAPSLDAINNLNQGRPTFFTENKGQWDERVLFKADGTGGLTWFIERDGFTILFSVPDMDAEPIADPFSEDMPGGMRAPGEGVRYPKKGHALKFKFQNTLPRNAGNFLPEQTTPAIAASVEPSAKTTWNNNYFLGNDPSKYGRNCGNFQQATLKDVWPGVDVVWRSQGKHAEFDFQVHPNADPNAIRVEVQGLTGDLETASNGDELLLPTSLGVLRQSLPEAYQVKDDGLLTPVRAEFKVAGANAFGVALPEGWNKAEKLIVDPLVYSTYLGNVDRDIATAIVAVPNAPDGQGGVVVTGPTTSEPFFPGQAGAFDGEKGGGDGQPGGEDAPQEWDVFVARLDENGANLIYWTYLGGSGGDEWSRAICTYPPSLDADGFIEANYKDGYVVVVGKTDCNDFPQGLGFNGPGYGYQPTYEGGAADAFIAELNSDGSELIYSTYLGGTGVDEALAVIPSQTHNGNGGVVVAGWTTSNADQHLPATPGAYQDNLVSSWDGFVAQISFGHTQDENYYIDNHRLEDLIYFTYLGGSGSDKATALSAYGDSSIIVAGYTGSGDFPTFPIADQNGEGGAYQPNYGTNVDAFVARLRLDGNDAADLRYSTYLGGSGRDVAWAVTVLKPKADGGVMQPAEMRPTVVVAGETNSDDFPIYPNDNLRQAFQTTPGDNDNNFDGFITRLNLVGGAGWGDRNLIYSTYLGGDSSDCITAIIPAYNCEGGVVRWSFGAVMVAGYTNSQNFPTAPIPQAGGAFQMQNGGSFDAFVSTIYLEGNALSDLRYSTYLGGTSGMWMDERANGLAANGVVAGVTGSDDFPINWDIGAIQPEHQGREDAFVTKIQFPCLWLDPYGYYGPIDPVPCDEWWNPWFGYPDFRAGYAGKMVSFPVLGSGSDSEAQLRLSYSSEDIPRSARFEDHGDGTGIFRWQTTYRDSGIFTANFTISDGRRTISRSRQIGVPPAHYRDYVETADNHSILITSVRMTDDDGPGGPGDPWWCLKHGVFTTSGILAGGGYWTGDGQLGMAAWGDDPETEEVEGFVAGERMHFRTWDEATGVEHNMVANVLEGSLDWQADGETVIELVEGTEMEIDLIRNWNLISLNVIPLDSNLWAGNPGPEIIPMMEQFGDNLHLMKDEHGRFYWPRHNFNNIPYWDLTTGYQVKVDSATHGSWSGSRIPASADIPIDRGWNMIAYFPTYELDASSPDFYAVSPILEHIIHAKNRSGQFMRPTRNFSNMEPWRESQGYQIKVDADVILNYPVERAIEEDTLGEGDTLRGGPREHRPGHWAVPQETGVNMSVLISSVTGLKVQDGDQVAAFDSKNNLVGVGTVQDGGMCGLAVWGDDASTVAVDGLINGEAFTLRIWSAEKEAEYPLEASAQEGSMTYETDGFASLVANASTSIPEDYYLAQSYPNPFNAVTRIAFGLPEASRVSVRVFDVSGREVATVVSGNLQAGNHTAVWNAEGFTSGIYLVKMEAGSFSDVRKVTLVK